MKNISFKTILPHLTAIILFLVLSFAYFPSVIQGEKLQQMDVKKYEGMAKEVKQYRERTGKEALWTNSMFGGMPAYLISVHYPSNLTTYIHQALNFDQVMRPINYIFVSLLGFYIALLIFGVNPWLSIIGAIAFTFSSYFFIIIEAGHLTKVQAITYISPIIAGVYAAFRKKLLLGAAVMGLFLAFQLLLNHLQITYYTFLIVLIFGIFELVQSIKNKQLAHFGKATGILIVAAILAVGTSSPNMLLTYQYGQYSTRGESELTITNQQTKTSGLDKDYVTAWSHGIGETFTLLIPDFKGGSSYSNIGTDSETYHELARRDPQYAKNFVKNAPTYWGEKPFTSGPFYVGAIIFFLFILGLFLIKGQIKWWLLTATLLSIMLAWGKHFMVLTDLFLDYFPGYNKFRTVSMILVIAEFTMPLLAILTIDKLIKGKIPKNEFKKAFKVTLAIVGGILLLFTLLPGAFFDFVSQNDQQLKQMGWDENLIGALRHDRLQMLRSDAIRSLVFVLLGAGVLWLYVDKKLKKKWFYTTLGLLILIDMWAVDKRYLNNEDFVDATKAQTPWVATQADKEILQDKELNYRVLNLATSTFNDGQTSYYHKSIGGYHGAKMQHYQELIDFHISKNIQNIISTFNNNPSDSAINATLAEQEVLNMLNTKYIIYNPEAPPLQNYHRLGNAWFVENYKWAENADKEIMALADFEPEKTAIINERFKKQLKGFTPEPDSSSRIKLVEYQPNYLFYQSNTQKDQLAVFSEIYYPKGWNAYIDEEKQPHFRANYVLRAMLIPAGKHKIEFKFEPQLYSTGNTIALASSIILLLFVGGVFFMEIKKYKPKQEQQPQEKKKINPAKKHTKNTGKRKKKK